MSENGTEDNANLMKGDYLLLVFDKETFGVTVHGNVANNDMALAILAQAGRCIENQVKIEMALAAQAQVRKQVEDNARVGRILDLSRKH